ncbi:hypothetical protein QFC19_007651 [Naganishia cerealis]|uniref:Uncharacterized protein n=1 Tax=Naganishia cerealis TaxID=610337 RepID=A0ACC2V802_9TREE|nr:hypothetical protein QFC19_007651 [Naganishia cerealis]
MPKASKNPRAKLHSKAAASVKATKEDQTTAAAPVSVPVSEPAEVPAAAPITGGGKKARYAGVESKIPGEDSPAFPRGSAEAASLTSGT